MGFRVLGEKEYLHRELRELRMMESLDITDTADPVFQGTVVVLSLHGGPDATALVVPHHHNVLDVEVCHSILRKKGKTLRVFSI